MKIPKKIKKNNRKFIYIKRYPNFVLYEEFLTGYKECFSFYDLGLIEGRGKVYNFSPNKVKK